MPRSPVQSVMPRFAAAALALSLSLAPLTAGPGDWDHARGALVGALAEGRASGLEPLLPAESKVYLDLSTLRKARGYFGADQVVAVFERFFAAHRVLGFDAPADEAPPTGRSTRLGGELRYADSGGRTRSVTLVFTLSRAEGGWTVREVREGSRR